MLLFSLLVKKHREQDSMITNLQGQGQLNTQAVGVASEGHCGAAGGLGTAGDMCTPVVASQRPWRQVLLWFPK